MPIKKLSQQLSTWRSPKNQLSASAHVTDFDVYKEEEIPEEIAKRIIKATSSVRMCFYKFHGDSAGGRKIIAAFQELATKATEEHPVHVRILLNQRGGIAQKFYKPNDESNLESVLALQKKHPHFKVNLSYHKAQALDTYHAKNVIIDPDTSAPYVFFCGGDIQKANDPERHQYETALMVKGREMAMIAARDFDKLAIPPRANKDNAYSLMMAALTRTDLVTTKSTEAKHNALYLSSRAHANPFTQPGMAPFKKMLIESIRDAKHSVHILTANLNDRDIIRELAQAANRGVAIKLMMGKHHNDSAEKRFGGTNLSSIKYLDSLVNNESKKFLRVHWVMNPETKELVLHGQAYTMHGKFCMVDQKLLLMGSSPLDKQAMRGSREIDTVLRIPTPQKADSILSKLFKTPYAFGRDFYIDEVITILTKESQRLQKYSDPLSKSKVDILQNLIAKLSTPSFPPQEALALLEEARPIIGKKRNEWHSDLPKSFKALENCIAICTVSQSDEDTEEYREAVSIQEEAIHPPRLPTIPEEQEQDENYDDLDSVVSSEETPVPRSP